MADQLTPNDWRALDANGDPVSGALAYWYVVGTTTPLTVYSDTALTTPHASPQVADANGVFAQVFVASGVAAKVDVKDPDTAASLPGYPQDNVPVSASASSAASISFDAVTGNSADNVQDAVANVTADVLALENQSPIYATAGSSNAYTITTTTPITAYATGQSFSLRVDRDNTGAVTLNVDGVGAKDVQSYDSAGSLAALASGQWQIGQIIDVIYDGTRFVQTTPLPMSQTEVETGTADFPRLVTPAVVKAGIAAHAKVSQVVRTQTAAYASGSGTIPDDTSKPQNTEGTEFMTVSATPTSASSTLRIQVLACVQPNGPGPDQVIGALFVDSDADALAADRKDSHSDGGPLWLVIDYTVASGSTSARTYKFRAGRPSGNTDFNGSGAGAAILGGIVFSSITITEYL